MIKPFTLVLAFVITVAGGYTSWAVFRFLAANRKPPSVAKDTIFVKLVDGVPWSAPRPVQDTTGAKWGQPQTIGSRGPLQRSDTPFVSHRQNLRPNPIAIPIPQDTINAYTAKAKLIQAKFAWWAVILGGLLLLAALFYVLYDSLPFLSSAMRKDLDPQPLQQLFGDFATKIQALGNPRKIKRLSNRIRFQYHYMVSKGFGDPVSLGQLASTLLLLEGTKDTAATGPTPIKDILQTPQSFTDFLLKNSDTRYSAALGNEKFVRLLYALNRDSFY